ncbi:MULTISPECIES: nuclear transport factor 2 family protein [unclassified Streptomyces]|uniref:nuclear transport factor 2 family protein n=1 Tax=unclassified Streptomyces TaxID=2593676 RepID=UPI00339FDA68
MAIDPKIDPKDVVQAFVDALNRQDWDRLDELITPDFTYTIQAYDLPGAGAPMTGETLVGSSRSCSHYDGSRYRTLAQCSILQGSSCP